MPLHQVVELFQEWGANVKGATVAVSVEVPQSLVFEAGLSTEAASGALLRSFVLSLFRQDRIGSGKAARLLGMHRMEFIHYLSEKKLPYLDYTPEELQADIDTPKQWQTKSWYQDLVSLLAPFLDQLLQLHFHFSRNLQQLVLHGSAEPRGYRQPVPWDTV